MIDMNKKYRYKNGDPCRILCVDGPNEEYPVISIKDNRASVATFHDKSGIPSYRPADKFSLVEVSPYEHLKKDDKVLVWNNGYSDSRYKRHFSHIGIMGKPYAFTGGQTSWTGSETRYWDNAELYEGEE